MINITRFWNFRVYSTITHFQLITMFFVDNGNSLFGVNNVIIVDIIVKILFEKLKLHRCTLNVKPWLITSDKKTFLDS